MRSPESITYCSSLAAGQIFRKKKCPSAEGLGIKKFISSFHRGIKKVDGAGPHHQIRNQKYIPQLGNDRKAERYTRYNSGL